MLTSELIGVEFQLFQKLAIMAAVYGGVLLDHLVQPVNLFQSFFCRKQYFPVCQSTSSVSTYYLRFIGGYFKNGYGMRCSFFGLPHTCPCLEYSLWL